MSSEVLVAILGFIGTLIGSGFGALASSRLTNYRLEQVENKVSALSDNVQRIALLEKRSDDYEKRIDKLENKNA